MKCNADSISHKAIIEFIAQQLLQTSVYIQRQCKHLQTVLSEELWIQSFSFADYKNQLHNFLNLPLTEFSKQIRYFRHQHLIRLLLCEKAGLSGIEETLAVWSEIADALIEITLTYCCQLISKTHGIPRASTGMEVVLYPLALGKLGGRELNFSSDIDLIFAYSAAGETDGTVSISNEKYFIKVIQQFIYLFQENTTDGFVFRVDLRLRPFGSSGSLVMTLTAMETYYQEQGRDWERYAMIKARLIGLHREDWFERILLPFVYRRYVDYSVIESLRSMKAMIHQEVRLNPALNDIKRGRGGIREIEFIVQSFQLIRGGQLLQLQTSNTLIALDKLHQKQLLSYAPIIREAYLFYRKLENIIQTYADQQTHQLPQFYAGKEYVLWMMDLSTEDDLIKKLSQYQRIISRIFDRILQSGKSEDNEQKLISNQLKQLWQGHVETSMAINVLTSLGLQSPERCYQMIQAFRHAPKCKRLSQAARLRLDQFMVHLLHALIHVAQADSILLSFIRLLENIMGRSTYLALLTENKVAIPKLCYWFATSEFITTLVVSYPFLLDVLIFQDELWQRTSRSGLKSQLDERLKTVKDPELQENVLREFKLTQWLIVACAELNGCCKATEAAQFLSDVAEVVVQAVVELACIQLKAKYIGIDKVAAHFTIIAYGKLGSREMNYDSDLDLVFLHDVSPTDERLVTRLTQKILHMLTTRSWLGLLYSTDTRLKPSGSSGLLVSRFHAFVAYQCEQAWTWEHQALIKARVLWGNHQAKREFFSLKQIVFLRVRDKSELIQNIQNMRQKMGQHITSRGLKYDTGGLLDLEFLIQYLVLSNPTSLWCRVTHPLLQLHHLYQRKLISSSQFNLLKRAYFYFHQSLHQQFLRADKTAEGVASEIADAMQKLLFHLYK